MLIFWLTQFNLLEYEYSAARDAHMYKYFNIGVYNFIIFEVTISSSNCMHLAVPWSSWI